MITYRNTKPEDAYNLSVQNNEDPSAQHKRR